MNTILHRYISNGNCSSSYLKGTSTNVSIKLSTPFYSWSVGYLNKRNTMLHLTTQHSTDNWCSVLSEQITQSQLHCEQEMVYHSYGQAAFTWDILYKTLKIMILSNFYLK